MTNDMMKLRPAFRFFLDNAGYAIDHRVKNAMGLAKAEQEGEELGLSALWEPDQDPDLSWLDQEGFESHKAKYGDGRRWAEACRVPHPQHDATLASLSGIDMGSTDGDAAYRRVVEAELMQEAIAALKEEQAQDSQSAGSHSLTVNITVKDGGSREDAIDMLQEALDEYRANVDEDEDMIEHFTIEGSDEDDEHDPAPLHGICQCCGQEIRE